MSTIASLIVSLRADTGPFSGSMSKSRQEFSGLVNVVEGGTSRITGLLGTLAAGLGAGGIIASAGVGVKLAADFEKAQVGLEVMLGSVDRAKSLLAGLEGFAASSQFDLPGVVEATRKLIAFGESDRTALTTLRMLGDVAAGANVPLSDLAQIYSKARSRGILDSREIKELQNQGIPIVQQLARQFNVAGGEVKQLADDGRISFASLQQALTSLTSAGGIYYQMTARDSQTIGGLYKTLSDNVGISLRKMAEQAITTFNLKDGITQLSNAIDRATTSIVPIVKSSFEWVEANRQVIMSASEIAAGLAALSIGKSVLTVLANQTLGWVATLKTAGDGIGTLKALLASSPARGGPLQLVSSGKGEILADVTSLGMLAQGAEKAAGKMKLLGAARPILGPLTLEQSAEQMARLVDGPRNTIGSQFAKFIANLRGGGIRAAVSDLGLFSGAASLASSVLSGLGTISGVVFSVPAAGLVALAGAGVMTWKTIERMHTSGDGFFKSWQDSAYSLTKPLLSMADGAIAASDKLELAGSLANDAKAATARAASAKTYADLVQAQVDRVKALYAQLDNAQKNVAADTPESVDFKSDTRFVGSVKKMIAETTAQLGSSNVGGFDLNALVASADKLASELGRPEITQFAAMVHSMKANADQNASFMNELAASAAAAAVPFKQLADLKAEIDGETAKASTGDFAKRISDLAAKVGAFAPEVIAARDALQSMNTAEAAADVATLTANLKEQIKTFGLEGAAAEMAKFRNVPGLNPELLKGLQQAADQFQRLNDAKKLTQLATGGDAIRTLADYADHLTKIRAMLADQPNGMKTMIDKLNDSLNTSLKDRANSLIDSLVTPTQKLKNDVAEIIALYQNADLSAQQMNALIGKAQSGLANDFASKLQQGPEAIVKGSAADVQATYKAEQRSIAEEYAKEAVDQAKRAAAKAEQQRGASQRTLETIADAMSRFSSLTIARIL